MRAPVFQISGKMADQSPNMAPPPNSSTANSNTSSSTPPKASQPPPLSPPPPQLSPPSPPLSPPPLQNSPPPSNSANNNSTQNGKGLSFVSPPASTHDKPPSSVPPPSSPHNSGNGENSTGSDSSSDVQYLTISLPVIAGVAGAIVLLITIVGIVSCISKRRRKRKPHNHMQYYADSSGLKVTDSTYYIGAQTQTNQITTGGIWHPSPPPPPPPITSENITSSGPHGPPLPPPSPIMALGFNKCMFTYEELSVATNGFDQSNLLGQGGFGYVHKGVLPNGKEIAVKSLKSGSGQGEREFQAEVDIISRIHHRHLVSLVGYCCSGSARLLVYDFVPNNTLDYHLHGKGLPTMDWPTRLKIALGSAKGLAYLHEDCHPRIIHRDIKSSNILLNLNFEAMVADFGLAKLSSDKDTHVSTRVMGTFGYLAPEYASSGKLTEKSDVFSYGVMLLEIITGKRPTDNSHTFMEDSLIDWARPVLSQALTDGNYDEIADPNLTGKYDPAEMARMVACAAASVRHSARRRPKMSQIVRALEGGVPLEDLNEGIRPGQSMLFSSGSDYDSDNVYSHYSSMRRNNNRPKKMMMIDGPDRLSSDEFSDPKVEYAGHGLGSRGSSSSDFALSDELSPVENQRLRAHHLPPG